MANQKGNKYPNWAITNEFQVLAYDSQAKPHTMSDADFASDMGISEDGTVWVLSNKPDATEGEGSLIYYGDGTNNWIQASAVDGAYAIAGGPGGSCYYLNSDSQIVQLNTDGTGSTVYSDKPVIEMDYGGGYIWALIMDEKNATVGLYFANAGSSLSFTDFNFSGNPTNISVDYSGRCVAAVDFDPYYFSTDGSSYGSAGSGADGKTVTITSKNWTYLVSTDINNSYQNIIMVWEDTQGGKFTNTAMYGMRVYGTYYSGV